VRAVAFFSATAIVALAIGAAALGLTTGCGLAYRSDADGAVDSSLLEAGATDGGATDGRATDGGATDGGATDGGATDGGATDGGATDGGAVRTWRVTVVNDTHDAQRSSLVADGQDVHVVFHDSDQGDLLYSHRPADGLWGTPITVDHAGSVGWDPSLAVGPSGSLHVAYGDFTGGRGAYAYKAMGRPWSTPEIAVDGDATGDIGRASIAVAPDGTVHMFVRRSYPADDVLHARRVPTGMGAGRWEAADTVNADGVLGTTGGRSLAIDLAGGLHATYFDHSSDALEYAHRTPAGVWSNEHVASFDDRLGQSESAIAVDTSGNVHLSYHDYDEGSLRYLERAPGAAWSEPVRIAAPGGENNCLAVGADGAVHVGLYNDVLERLEYVHRTIAGTWHPPEVVDTDGDVGALCSLTIDEARGVHMTYRDVDARRLKHAYLAP
jgi:hypothetical protein